MAEYRHHNRNFMNTEQKQCQAIHYLDNTGSPLETTCLVQQYFSQTLQQCYAMSGKCFIVR